MIKKTFQHIQLPLVLLVFLLTLTNVKYHEYYVSVTTITHNTEQQSLQIISQLFIDDFETVLRQRYQNDLIIDDVSANKTVTNYIKQYYASKLKITVNQQQMTPKFIGKEFEDDMVFTYLEIENVSNLQAITIKNMLLYNAFPGQQNIVRVKTNTANKSYLLYKEQPICTLNLK